mgnify:CR=1 FL=1
MAYVTRIKHKCWFNFRGLGARDQAGEKEMKTTMETAIKTTMKNAVKHVVDFKWDFRWPPARAGDPIEIHLKSSTCFIAFFIEVFNVVFTGLVTAQF